MRRPLRPIGRGASVTRAKIHRPEETRSHAPDFDPTTRIARSIADGTALDVVEMDAASQRGIDEVREIRERAMLQPVEGR